MILLLRGQPFNFFRLFFLVHQNGILVLLTSYECNYKIAGTRLMGPYKFCAWISNNIIVREDSKPVIHKGWNEKLIKKRLWTPLGIYFLEVPGVQHKMSHNRVTTEKSFPCLKEERISETINPITCEFYNDKAIVNLFFHLCDTKEGASYFKYGINIINKVKKYFYILFLHTSIFINSVK